MDLEKEILEQTKQEKEIEENKKAVQVIEMAQRFLRPRAAYPVNKFVNDGEVLQLVLNVGCEMPDGERRVIKALVDTGAEENLIRMGIIPSKYFQRAGKLLKFVAANGTVMSGGDRTTKLKLEFRRQDEGGQISCSDFREGEFYESEIRVDMILSYPWMVKNKIGIFPHHKALVVDEPKFALLFGVPTKKDEKRKTKNIAQEKMRKKCAIWLEWVIAVRSQKKLKRKEFCKWKKWVYTCPG